MPSVSKKQHNLMAMVAHDKAAAKRLGIPQSVGKEFTAADKGKKFGMGGSATVTRGGKEMINKQGTRMGSTLGYQKEVPNINLNKYIGKKSGGSINLKEGNIMAKAKGVPASGMGKVVAGGKRPHGEHTVQQKGHTKGKHISMKKGGKC